MIFDQRNKYYAGLLGFKSGKNNCTVNPAKLQQDKSLNLTTVYTKFQCDPSKSKHGFRRGGS